MRLIDADALLRSHCSALDDEYESCEECLEPPYGCCCLEIRGEDIYSAPTIDAIPVEWMENKRKEALHEGMRPDEVEAVEMVLWMWQKEQEAR